MATHLQLAGHVDDRRGAADVSQPASDQDTGVDARGVGDSLHEAAEAEGSAHHPHHAQHLVLDRDGQRDGLVEQVAQAEPALHDEGQVLVVARVAEDADALGQEAAEEGHAQVRLHQLPDLRRLDGHVRQLGDDHQQAVGHQEGLGTQTQQGRR